MTWHSFFSPFRGLLLAPGSQHVFDIMIIPTEAGWSSGAGSVSHYMSLLLSFQYMANFSSFSFIIQGMMQVPLIIGHTD